MTIEQTIAAHTDALRFLADRVADLTVALTGRATIAATVATASPLVEPAASTAETLFVSDGSTVSITAATAEAEPSRKRSGRPRKVSPAVLTAVATDADAPVTVAPVAMPAETRVVGPDEWPFPDAVAAAAAPLVEPAPAANEPAEAVSLETVQATMVDAIAKAGGNTVKTMLASQYGVERVSALAVEKLPAVYAALAALIAAATGSKGDDAK